MSTSTTTATEDRALILLGKGIPPTAVAQTLGVDPSRITQLLGQEVFAQKVIELKYNELSKHTMRDSNIDELEDKLLEKLKDAMVFMTRPMEILKAFSVLNASKRRGQVSQEGLQGQQSVVQLVIPTIILQKFTTNVHNQVTQVGQQSLLTIPSGQLLKGAQDEQTRKIGTSVAYATETITAEQISRSEDARDLARTVSAG